MPLPLPKAVRDLLAQLLGREVDVTPCSPVVPSQRRPAALGVYVDDSLRLSHVVVADVALSAFAGAAIGLVPPRVAEDAVEDVDLSPMLAENFAEVLNVLASVLSAAEGRHLRLYAVHTPGELPPSDVSAWARAPAGRLDQALEVAGYGTGHLGIVSCL